MQSESLSRRSETRLVTSISGHEIIGIEEFLRCQVLKDLQKQRQHALDNHQYDEVKRLDQFDLSEDLSTSFYSFTAVVESMTA